MTDAQKLAIGRFDRAWVVDFNFQDEPIVYTHVKDSAEIKEYVVDSKGKTHFTASYPYTVRLKAELNLYK